MEELLKNAIILVDKPVNWTSNDVVAYIKRRYKIKKAGHEGTLDPFASGLLLIFTEAATKVIPFSPSMSKRYRARLQLGVKTDSGDNSGKVIQTAPIPELNKDIVKIVLNSFLGTSKQLPPMYSAKKVNGKRLYQLARLGREVTRSEVEITIDSIVLEDFGADWIQFSTIVSRGTYIRTLGEDIASKLNTVGHLTSLRRTHIGAYDVDTTYPADCEKQFCTITIAEFLNVPRMEILDEQRTAVANGHPLALLSDSPLVLLVDKEKEIALYKQRDEMYYCARGLNYEKN